MMGVKIREKAGKLYLDVYHQGRRHWEALRISVGPDEKENREALRLAEVCRQKRELQLASGEWGLLDPVEGKRPLLEYAHKLAAEKNPKDPLPKSLKYLEEYGRGIKLEAVNERWMEGYQSFLLQKDLAPSTAEHYAAALRWLLKRAVRDMVIPRNPAEAVKAIRVPESVRVTLNVEELERLARSEIGGKLGAEVRRAFMFACFTGLRISDLRNLKWADISRDPLQIVKRQRKTRSVVGIPLNESAWGIIDDKSIHNRDELVFPLLSSSETNTNQYLVKWAKDAGLEKRIGWHTARHTFATLALDGGADISTVSRLLGHRNLRTTTIYAKTTDRAKRAAVQSLPAIDLEQGRVIK